MATPTPVFPAAVATNANLKAANNLIQTSLKVGMGATDTILFVNSTAGFTANCVVSIDKEIIAIATVVAAPNATLIVASGGRGFDGTVAAAHTSGATVSMLIVAWHHNALATEVEAIEGFIGPNGQNLSSMFSGILNAKAYNFAPIQPGGSLVTGINVITIAPVPLGINGNDANHYLYISGGTGTPEAVLITGGTAAAGAASGTLIFSCAGPHSGAWTITSASAGIAEALITAGNFGAIVIPAGTWPIKAPVTTLVDQSIAGSGSCSTILRQDFTNGDCLVVNNIGGNNSDIRGIGFNTSVTVSSGWLLHIIGGDGTIDDIVTDNGLNGIQLDAFTRGRVTNVVQRQFSGIGMQIGGTTGPAGPTIANHTISTTAGNNATAMNIYSGLMTLTNFDYQVIGTNTRGILFASNSPQGSGETTITNGIIDSALQSIYQIGTGNFVGVSISNLYLVNGNQSGDNLAIVLGGTGPVGQVSLSNVTINGMKNILGLIQITSAGATALNGINIGSCRATTTGISIGAGGAVKGFTLGGSNIGSNFNATPDPNILIGVNLTGGADYITITGNYIAGSQAPIVFGAVGTNLTIAGNNGIDNVIPSVASAGTIAAPINPTFIVTGVTTVTAISGYWTGRTIRVLYPSGAGITVMGHVLAAGGSVILTSTGVSSATWY